MCEAMIVSRWFQILREALLPELAPTTESKDNVELSMSGTDNIPGCRFVGEANRWKHF